MDDELERAALILVLQAYKTVQTMIDRGDSLDQISTVVELNVSALEKELRGEPEEMLQ